MVIGMLWLSRSETSGTEARVTAAFPEDRGVGGLPACRCKAVALPLGEAPPVAAFGGVTCSSRHWSAFQSLETNSDANQSR